MSNLGEVLSKLLYLKRITNRGLGADTLAAESYVGFSKLVNFCKLLENKAILMPLGHILHVFRAI